MRNFLDQLVVMAHLFETETREPSDFFYFKPSTDINQAWDDIRYRDHATRRAFERAETPQEAIYAIKYGDQIVDNLNGNGREFMFMLPNGSEWWFDVSKNLLAVFKKVEGKLTLATFLHKKQIIPSTNSGSLETEIERLKKLKFKK